MAKADKEYTYYRDKHILFEGDVIVFKRPKSTPDEERERATHECWQMQLKIPGCKRITQSTKTGNLGDALSISDMAQSGIEVRQDNQKKVADMAMRAIGRRKKS